jgi:hypothetical protein
VRWIRTGEIYPQAPQRTVGDGDMTKAVELYVSLEGHAVSLNGEDNELAERVHDLMDFIWYKRFSTEEKQHINDRSEHP